MFVLKQLLSNITRFFLPNIVQCLVLIFRPTGANIHSGANIQTYFTFYIQLVVFKERKQGVENYGSIHQYSETSR